MIHDSLKELLSIVCYVSTLLKFVETEHIV